MANYNKHFGYILEDVSDKGFYIQNLDRHTARTAPSKPTAMFFKFENIHEARGFCQCLKFMTGCTYRPEFAMRRQKPVKL